MDAKIGLLCVCLSVDCASSSDTARTDESERSPTLQRLEELLSGPPGTLRLSTDEDSAAMKFQFELRGNGRTASGESSWIRAVVERDEEQAGLLALTKGGVAYAHVGDEGVTLLNRSRPGRFWRLPGVFEFRLRDLAGVTRSLIGLTSTREASVIELDLRGLIQDILDIDHDVTVDERTSTVTLRKANGSWTRIRLNRERCPYQFPIASFSLADASGQGITLTHFHLKRTAPRSVCRLPQLHAPTDPPVPGSSQHSGNLPAEFAHGLYVEEDLVTQIDTEDVLRAAARELLEAVPRHRAFSATQRERMLELLHMLARQEAVEVTRDAWMSAFEEFSELIGKETFRRASTVEPATELSRPVDYSCIVGYDRRRSAHLLEVRAGPDLAARVYSILQQAVLRPPHNDPAERIGALEMLAALGIPEQSTLLQEIESALAGDADPWVRTFLALLRACTGTPTDADVARLRAAAQDTEAVAKYRYVCMEALLLLDETDGLESTLYDLITQRLAGDYYMMRCLLSAGCTREGLNVLIRLGMERREPSIGILCIYRLYSAVQPGDEHWEAFMVLLKEVALDADQPLVWRDCAGVLAAVDQSDAAFRERFATLALRTDDKTLGHGMVFLNTVHEYYFAVDPNTHKFAREFERLLIEAPRATKRRRIARVFTETCPVPLPSEGRDDVVRLIERMLSDPDWEVQTLPLGLLRRCKQAGGEAPMRLLSALLESARRSRDGMVSVSILIILSELSDGSFRFDYPAGDAGKMRLDGETFLWIRDNRRRLESEALRWLKTQQEAVPPREPLP